VGRGARGYSAGDPLRDALRRSRAQRHELPSRSTSRPESAAGPHRATSTLIVVGLPACARGDEHEARPPRRSPVRCPVRGLPGDPRRTGSAPLLRARGPQRGHRDARGHGVGDRDRLPLADRRPLRASAPPGVRCPRVPWRDAGRHRTCPRRAAPACGLPHLRAALPRQAARIPRLGCELTEAAADARGDDELLRDLVRQRPPGRVRTGGACDPGPRGRAREDPRAPERPVGTRGDLRPQRDRGDQSRGVRMGLDDAEARRHRGRDGARAPLELRPLAVHRLAHGRELPPDPAGRARGAPPRGARRARTRRDIKVVARRRLQFARHGQSVERLSAGARARRDHGRGRGAGGATPQVDVQALGCDFAAVSAHKMCGPSGVGRSGDGPSCSRRWSPSLGGH
jgi:hypothetical protein